MRKLLLTLAVFAVTVTAYSQPVISRVQDIPNVNRASIADTEVLSWDEATGRWIGIANGGGSQTPWTGDIDGAEYAIDDVSGISVTNSTTAISTESLLGISVISTNWSFGVLTNWFNPAVYQAVFGGADGAIALVGTDEGTHSSVLDFVEINNSNGDLVHKSTLSKLDLAAGGVLEYSSGTDSDLSVNNTTGTTRILFGQGYINLERPAGGWLNFRDASASVGEKYFRFGQTNGNIFMGLVDDSNAVVTKFMDGSRGGSVLDTLTWDNITSMIVGASAVSSAKLSVKGDADQVQFAVQGFSTQTSDLLQLKNSAGTTVFSVDNAGDVSGGTMDITGTTTTGSIEFEGTPDAFETTIGVVDPTADRAINFQDASGTVAHLSDVPDHIFIGAGAFIPNTTNGGTQNTTEVGSNNIMVDSIDFNDTTDQFAGAWFHLPDNYVAGAAVGVLVHWTVASGSSTVEWECSIRAYTNDDPLDATLTYSSVSDTVIAINDEHIAPVISAMTILGTTPVAGDRCYVSIARDPDGADAHVGDAKFLGISIEY